MTYSINTVAGNSLRVAGPETGLMLEDAFKRIIHIYSNLCRHACDPSIMDENGREVWPTVRIDDMTVFFARNRPDYWVSPTEIEFAMRAARGEATQRAAILGQMSWRLDEEEYQ